LSDPKIPKGLSNKPSVFISVPENYEVEQLPSYDHSWVMTYHFETPNSGYLQIASYGSGSGPGVPENTRDIYEVFPLELKYSPDGKVTAISSASRLPICKNQDGVFFRCSSAVEESYSNGIYSFSGTSTVIGNRLHISGNFHPFLLNCGTSEAPEPVLGIDLERVE
jgi:hypothetical protein